MSANEARAEPEIGATRWIAAADVTALQQAATQRIVDAAARAIGQRGRFLIVLAGGNTPRGVYDLLRAASTDWSRWHVYFGDERCLPPDDAERNSRIAADVWLERVPIAHDHLHLLSAEIGRAAAEAHYADTP